MFYLFPYISPYANKQRRDLLENKCWVKSKDINKVVEFAKTQRIMDYAIETLPSSSDDRIYKELK